MSESIQFFFLYSGVIFLLGIIIGYYAENLYLKVKAHLIRRKFKRKAKIAK